MLAVTLLTIWNIPAYSRILPTEEPVPNRQLTAADWAQIRAQYIRHRYGAHPQAWGGYSSRNAAHRFWVRHTPTGGFELRPDGQTWTWGLRLTSVNGQKFGAAASMAVDGNRVTHQWGEGVEEWLLNDPMGLEQGFVIARIPGGKNALDLTLQASGAGMQIIDRNGDFTIHTADGQKVLRYSGLKAWDAAGTPLPAKMTAAGGEIRIHVETANARLPITIDPMVQQAYFKPAAVGSSQAGDRFGASVAIWGDTVAVGAPGEDGTTGGINPTPSDLPQPMYDAGAVYVFVRSGTTWTQQAYLKVPVPRAYELFGTVALDNNTLVVGAPGEEGSNTGVNSTPLYSSTEAGAAFVFVRNGTMWTQQAYLKPAAVGSTQRSDKFGYSVAISGNTIAVGAVGEASSSTGINSTPNENNALAGAVYVFTRSGTTWTQQAYLKPDAVGTSQASDSFGFSIALDTDTLVVGAPYESSLSTGINGGRNESALGAGAAYVFFRSGSTWSQQAFLKPGAIGTAMAHDNFGYSVSISGNTIVAGAPGEDSSTGGINGAPNEGGQNSGAAFVFTRSGSTWSQQAFVKAATPTTDSFFGETVTVAADSLVVGAGTYQNRIYLFRRSGTTWTQDSTIQNPNPKTQDLFGSALALSGDTLIAGTPGDDSSSLGVNSTENEAATDAGAAYAYQVTTGSSPGALRFTPVAPCRVADTRNANGPFGGPAIPADGFRTFLISQACGLPGDAAAYSLNITVVPRGGLSYLTVWPGGSPRPLVSTLNSLDGRIKANAAIVPAGAQGGVSIYATDLTDVVIDVNGVFTPSGGQMFYPITPCRVYDSRVSGGTLPAQSTRTIPVANAGACGVPSNATAFATNVTVVPSGPLAYLTLWPNNGSAQPLVSTLNAFTGTVTANMAIVPAGSSGDIRAFVTDPTELVVDVTGYFAPPGGQNALHFYTATPCRTLDTRNANGTFGGPVMGDSSTRSVPIPTGSCGMPATARAYSVSATVIPLSTLGYLTLWPTGATQPLVSTLNAWDGALTSNAALLPAGTSGAVSAFVTNSSHLLLDLNGYFAP